MTRGGGLPPARAAPPPRHQPTSGKEWAGMPKVSNPARGTSPDGPVWRNCAGCSRLAALGPTGERCERCTTPTPTTDQPPRGEACLADCFTPGDLDEIADAGCGFAEAIADIAHHHIG